MKSYVKSIFPLLILAVAACSDPKESNEYKSMVSQNDSLRAQVAAKDQESEEVAASVNEIESNLAAIEKDELAISQLKKEGQEESQKDRINAMIAGIDSYIEQNRQKVEKLEQQVSKSRKRNAGLQKLVANLRASIAKKEEEIATLRSTISGLETENTGLKSEVAVRDVNLRQRDSMLNVRQQMIDERDTEIYTAYYISGNKKELRDAGIVDKSGGFLGMGKTAKVSGRIDKTKFTSINMKNTDDINLGVTKKNNVISSHPSDSYYFTKNGDEVHLKVTDYKRFWSLTKYLVIETK